MSRYHARACAWLIGATVLWGLSFPLIKAIWLAQEQVVPEARSIFLASLAACVRFGVAGILMALFAVRTLSKITLLEWSQGTGLAVFGGLGIVVQMDGLAHTSASTSAFLTQFYCVLIPIWAAWKGRRLPHLVIVVSTIMVLAGVAVLADVNWRELSIGRGEAETLLSAVFFAGQMLWLERPIYARNSVAHFTVIMFLGIAVLVMPMVFLTAPSSAALLRPYSSSAALWLMGALIAFCTLGAYVLMNRWQPHVTATEAGLIYCLEPVAASLFAALLPGWFSALFGIAYANERLTWRLAVGGTLITVANVLMQVAAARKRQRKSRDISPQC